MTVTPATDPAHLLDKKPLRYAAVTVLAAPANLVTYLALFVGIGTSAFAANLAAAVLVSIPTYELNRRWVWNRAESSAAEATAYLASTLFSVLMSSAALLLLAQQHVSATVMAAAPFAVYTALWVARYVFLDRYLFRGATTSS